MWRLTFVYLKTSDVRALAGGNKRAHIVSREVREREGLEGLEGSLYRELRCCTFHLLWALGSVQAGNAS